MTLYDRLASTPEGARGLAVARLSNECLGALAEALEEYKARPATHELDERLVNKRAAIVEREFDREDKGLTLNRLAELMHDMGKEIMITVVPAGEPRRIAEREMAERASKEDESTGEQR